MGNSNGIFNFIMQNLGLALKSLFQGHHGKASFHLLTSECTREEVISKLEGENTPLIFTAKYVLGLKSM